jgi:hypothetical protein
MGSNPIPSTVFVGIYIFLINRQDDCIDRTNQWLHFRHQPCQSYQKIEIILNLEKKIDFITEEVEKAKASPSFEREYNLECLGLVGNVQFFY